MTTSYDAVQALVNVAKAEHTRIKLRIAAVEGLGYAGGFEARTALVELLVDQREPDLQEAVARALGHAARE